MNEHDQHDEREDEALDPRTKALLSDYNEPTPLDDTRRARMFEQIQARRSRIRPSEATTESARHGLRRPAPRVRREWTWVAAAAAVLVLGIGIGRLLPSGTGPTEGPAPDSGVAASGERWSQETAEALYRLATLDYLGRTATLLTEFRQAAMQPTPEIDASPGPGTVRWAGDLLLETRLLLDSPAAGDDRLSVLLRDLELILAEIVQLSESADPRERALIQESLDDRSVLLRMQQQMPSPRHQRGA